MFVGLSVAYNFQQENDKIKLLMEYESVTEESFIWQRCARRIDVREKI
jgi:hypothetical protein